MLTILLFAAAISGSGDTTYAQANRNDLFIPLVKIIPCQSRPERLAYLKRLFIAQGASTVSAELTISTLIANQCYSKPRFKKNGGWKAWERDNLNDRALQRGAEFLKIYKETLALAKERYDISSNELAGVSWIETDFGDTLKDPAIVQNVSRALFSTMLRTNRKSRRGKPLWPWWAENVAAHFAQERALGRNPFLTEGSYAGAKGPLQFMPTTWADFGVAAEFWRIPDPENMRDAILSAANYLNKLGWRKQRLHALTTYNAGSHTKCPNGYAKIIANYVKKL
ncbi:MAG: Membrane-bound lytic murein transglycosylase [Candidatus Parcubacteria bacterium]|jgi:membrane-bound lytic murein transglycosylase B